MKIAIRAYLIVGMAVLTFVFATVEKDIPRTWDMKEIKRFHLPPPVEGIDVEYASEEDYYNLPEHVIYKTYPVYAEGFGPENYLDSLREVDPQIPIDFSQLRTQEEWIEAGEAVFHWPASLFPVERMFPLDSQYFADYNDFMLADGEYPFFKYTITEKGNVLMGTLSCANCHTRVMPDGSAIIGAQGNMAFDPQFAFIVDNFGLPPDRVGNGFYKLSGAPWLSPDLEDMEAMTTEEILGITMSAVPGTMTRQGTNFAHPIAVPSLIGVKDMKYLDRTGLMLHEGPGDMMRYAAFNQGLDMLTSYDGFIPLGENGFKDWPEIWRHPFGYDKFRYSDEQLYALTQFVYSLEPPENPNQFDETTLARGEQVFIEQACVTCHPPPLYTNNMLMPATGFEPPEEHFEQYDIFNVSAETDPRLALHSRRGTGYYKVPSLRGAWFRGPFLHNGSLLNLEDLFDEARFEDSYVPTGFKPHDVEMQAVPGHPFGIGLPESDRDALVAYLKSL